MQERTAAHKAHGRSHKDITAESDYCLYRLYDDEHDLLYVGATHNFRNRMQKHRANQVWWLDVYEPYTLTEWFDTPREVSDAEVRAIRDERPVWNRAGKTSAMIPYPHSFGPEAPIDAMLMARVKPTEESSTVRAAIEEISSFNVDSIEEKLASRSRM